MKFYLLIFLTILSSLILQLLCVGYLSIFGAGPQILLVCVIFFSLRYGALFGEIFGFISGLFLDTFAISIFGVNSLVFILVSYIYGNFSKKLDENKIGVQMLLVFIASYLHVGFMVLTSVIFTSRADISNTALIAVPVYTTLLSPLLIKIYDIWIGIVEKWSGKTNQV